MRIRFTKFDVVGVKVLLVRKSGDTVMVMEDGRRKGTCGRYVGLEMVIDEYERKVLENGDVLYREIA
ncbi:MAG: hypothetical protein IIY21_15200 [Clostridiales bacterium]|nr:hypothetical protein [Clostridiales bacterium]